MIGAIQNNYYTRQNKNNNLTKSQSFKGKFTDLVTKGIKHIETGGVLVDFVFVDTLGMVIPRTYQAFTRNREELDGKLNVKNGTEELIRELFSGPSMFVIPMIFIALSKKLFGEASKIQFKTLDSLTDSFGRLLKKAAPIKDKVTLKEDFYKNVFQEAFAKHKNIKSAIDVDSEVDKLVQHISAIEKGEKPKDNLVKIKEIVSDVNKAHGIHIDNSHNLTLKDGLTKEVGELVSDLVNYSQDIVGKVAAYVPKDKGEYLEKLHKSKVNGRRFSLVTTFLATTAFLYSVPIMYKQNIQFPGIDGLVKKRKQSNTPEVEQKEYQDKKDGNVSFGSKSSGLDKFFKKFDFKGTGVPYPILAFYTLGLMLGCRWFQARNADEKREVATRDFSGLTTIVFAVPVLRNITSTWMKKISGVPISKPLKTLEEHLNPRNKPLSFENITDIYSGASKLQNKLVDFSQNIDNNGGDLRKVLDFLGDDSKKALNEIYRSVSDKNTEVKPTEGIAGFLSKFFKAGKSRLNLPETNKEIIEGFKKAQKDGKFKPQLDVVLKELDNGKNSLVKFAEAQKSIPEALSIVAISGFLGWFLPWFNINYTKRLYRNKNAAEAQKQTEIIA